MNFAEPSANPKSAAAPGEAYGVGISLAGVRRIFPGGILAVGGVDCEIKAGSFVAFIGPSGCGKSTLLRLIAGLDAPSEGSVRVDSESSVSTTIKNTKKSIAFVFQDAHLLPWRTVLDNAALPLELAGINRKERRARAREALSDVGLSNAETRMPAELSGGMRMRVSIARALVTHPSLLLMDEPFGALDELTRNRLDEKLLALWEERKMTVLFVTHSISEAVFLAQRVLVFSPLPARIVHDHSIDFQSERNARLRAEPQFARHVLALHEALEQGGA